MNPSQSLLSHLQRLLLALLLLPWAAGVSADDGSPSVWMAPPSIDGSTTVVAEDLIALITERDDLVIVDARVAEDRLQGFIEGSISLPNTDTDCDALQGLAPQLEQPLALYCNGTRCRRSSESTQVALSCGYVNVFWFRGGIEEWQAKDYPTLK